jgi:hypothetical protein
LGKGPCPFALDAHLYIQVDHASCAGRARMATGHPDYIGQLRGVRLPHCTHNTVGKRLVARGIRYKSLLFFDHSKAARCESTALFSWFGAHETTRVVSKSLANYKALGPRYRARG